VPRTRRGRGHRDVAPRAEEDPRLARRAPSVTGPAGDGSVADAVWAGVRPEDVGLELLAQRRAEAGEVDQLDGEPPAQDTTAQQASAEAGDVDQSDGEPSAEETVSGQTETSRHGPQSPADKRMISKNALQDAFFAQHFHTIVGDEIADIAVFEEYLGGLLDTFHPVTFLDKARVHRLALLCFKRDQILEDAETGERKRSVLRHRRAVRFGSTRSLAELMEKDPPAVMRRSDGVAYIVAELEAVVDAVETMANSAEAAATVEVFERRFGAALRLFEEKVVPNVPASLHGNVSAMAFDDLRAALRCRRQLLTIEESRLRDEEAQLAAAELARRRVPQGKHFDRIARALRETNREIARLERDLAHVRGNVFGLRGR